MFNPSDGGPPLSVLYRSFLTALLFFVLIYYSQNLFGGICMQHRLGPNGQARFKQNLCCLKTALRNFAKQ